MSTDYWSGKLQNRLSRRRALATGGAGALGAAFLAACGGGSDSKGGGDAAKGPADTSGLLHQPVDTTKQAANGGILVNTIGNPTDGFTPYIGGNSISLNHVNHMYQRLLSYKNGENAQDADGTLEGDAASSWEITPDHLQITFKLRQNNKFDPRPPTNSRPLTTEDVKYSWEKLTGPGATSPNGKDLSNRLNPDAVITDLSFPDQYTVVMKLKEPAKPILGMIAYPWYLNLMPVEAADKFDVKAEAARHRPVDADQGRVRPALRVPDEPELLEGQPSLPGRHRLHDHPGDGAASGAVQGQAPVGPGQTAQHGPAAATSCWQ